MCRHIVNTFVENMIEQNRVYTFFVTALIRAAHGDGVASPLICTRVNIYIYDRRRPETNTIIFCMDHYYWIWRRRRKLRRCVLTCRGQWHWTNVRTSSISSRVSSPRDISLSLSLSL